MENVVKNFDLVKFKKKDKETFYKLNVYKKNNHYLLIKNNKFNFLKKLIIAEVIKFKFMPFEPFINTRSLFLIISGISFSALWELSKHMQSKWLLISLEISDIASPINITSLGFVFFIIGINFLCSWAENFPNSSISPKIKSGLERDKFLSDFKAEEVDS